MNHNTLDTKEYLKEHLYWLVIIVVWYTNLFFRCLPECSYKQTWIIVAVLFINVIAANIFITWKRERNSSSVAQTMILSCGILVFLSYWELFETQLFIVCVVDIGFSLIMIGIILFRKVDSTKERKQIMKARFYRSAMCLRRNTAVMMLIVMGLLAAKMLLSGSVLNSNIPVTKTYGDEYGLSANMDIIQNIEPSKWSQLDLDEKLDVCQCIANVEGRYLGISHELNCATADLADENGGYYSDATHQIVINTSYLEEATSDELVDIVTHEAYHAYQYEQVLLYQSLDPKSRNLHLFYDASVYLDELSHYTDGSQDYGEYYGQKVESDARMYAEESTNDYFNQVREYLNEHSNE